MFDIDVIHGGVH